MQRVKVFHPECSFKFTKPSSKQFDSDVVCILPKELFRRNHDRCRVVRLKVQPIMKYTSFYTRTMCSNFPESKTVDESNGELSDEEDDLCPVECVKEFKTDKELFSVLEKAKQTDSLVVVDFFRTSCGSCKYIEQGFIKLCKRAGEKGGVIFLKHNVMDEYDEQSETADRLRIKIVPLFHFYKGGVLLEAFPTRDKERILAAISKYTSSTSEDI